MSFCVVTRDLNAHLDDLSRQDARDEAIEQAGEELLEKLLAGELVDIGDREISVDSYLDETGELGDLMGSLMTGKMTPEDFRLRMVATAHKLANDHAEAFYESN